MKRKFTFLIIVLLLVSVAYAEEYDYAAAESYQNDNFYLDTNPLDWDPHLVDWTNSNVWKNPEIDNIFDRSELYSSANFVDFMNNFPLEKQNKLWYNMIPESSYSDPDFPHYKVDGNKFMTDLGCKDCILIEDILIQKELVPTYSASGIMHPSGDFVSIPGEYPPDTEFTATEVRFEVIWPATAAAKGIELSVSEEDTVTVVNDNLDIPYESASFSDGKLSFKEGVATKNLEDGVVIDDILYSGEDEVNFYLNDPSFKPEEHKNENYVYSNTDYELILSSSEFKEIALGVLPGNELFNTFLKDYEKDSHGDILSKEQYKLVGDVEDNLIVSVLGGDRLQIKSRDEEGLVPKVNHFSSGIGGLTEIENGRMQLRLKSDRFGFTPPEMIPLVGSVSDFLRGKQSVPMEIESDSSLGKDTLRLDSYNHYVILDEKSKEKIAFNKVDLPVSNRIEDNLAWQTLDDLKAAFPEIDIGIYDYFMEKMSIEEKIADLKTPGLGGEISSKNELLIKLLQNELSEIKKEEIDAVSPNALAVVSKFLGELSPEQLKKIGKGGIKFDGRLNAAYVTPTETLVFGERILDPESILKIVVPAYPGRDHSPLVTVEHEYTHREDYYIQEKEEEQLEEELVELEELFEGAQLERRLQQVEEIYEEEKLESKYNQLAQEKFAKDIYPSREFQRFVKKIDDTKKILNALEKPMRELMYSLDAEMAEEFIRNKGWEIPPEASKEKGDILRFYDLKDFINIKGEIEEFEDYLMNKQNEYAEKPGEEYFEVLEKIRKEAGVNIKPEDFQVYDSETGKYMYFPPEFLWVEGDIFSRRIDPLDLDAKQAEGLKIEETASYVHEMDVALGKLGEWQPLYKSLKTQFDKIETSLPKYVFRDYGGDFEELSPITKHEFSEVSAVYSEIPKEKVRTAIRKGDEFIRKATQLAYDSDKINKQEYQYRMGSYCNKNPCGKCLIYTLTCEE